MRFDRVQGSGPYTRTGSHCTLRRHAVLASCFMHILQGCGIILSLVGVRHGASCCHCKLAGRHPLCELLAPGRFINNDTTLGNSSTPAESSDSQLDGHTAAAAAGHSGGGGGGNSRMLLITGPNASGKSVYMKQVGSGMGQMCSGTFSPEPLRFMPASGCRQPAGS